MNNVQDTDNNLKWDVAHVVFTHAVLLLLLFGLIFFLAPVPFQLLGDFNGTLPLSARLLVATGGLWRHPGVTALLAVGFLFADGRIYAWLCRSKGKRAGTVWEISVTTTIALAIVWYTVLTLVFLNSVIRWRLK